MSIYDAAMKYAEEGTPLVVLAGTEYGSGSSRDWAAKGTLLLGVRAVIADSFERIHRSNLIGMGVLPLQFPDGESIESLGLTGEERFTIGELDVDSSTEVEVDRRGPDEGEAITVFRPRSGSTRRTSVTTTATAASSTGSFAICAESAAAVAPDAGYLEASISAVR